MLHNFLRYSAAALVTLATIVGQSAGRDLRPSEHGLAYQENAPRPTQSGDAQQMLSFFGSTPSSVPVPDSRNRSDHTWWRVHSGGGSHGNRRDHVKMGLLVASAVSGVAGVTLLVVSGITFFVRLRRQKREEKRLSSNSELHGVSDKQ